MLSVTLPISPRDSLANAATFAQPSDRLALHPTALEARIAAAEQCQGSLSAAARRLTVPAHFELPSELEAGSVVAELSGVAGSATTRSLHVAGAPSTVQIGCIDSMTSFSAAIRHRRDYAAAKLEAAYHADKRICVLACGQLREADQLVGQDLSNVVAVDLDLAALEQVWHRHGNAIELIEDNALTFLCATAQAGRQFDYIYTLGLADHCDEAAMELLHRLMKSCLAEGGEMMIASAMPDTVARGWMSAALSWTPSNRSEADLERYAHRVGLDSRTSRDPTGTIIFSEMSTPSESGD